MAVQHDKPENAEIRKQTQEPSPVFASVRQVLPPIHAMTKMSTEFAGGVTAPPLGRKGEERLASDAVAVRIQAFRFVLNAILLKRLPVATDPLAA